MTIPCQNGYKNDLTATPQHQKPNTSHSGPDHNDIIKILKPIYHIYMEQMAKTKDNHIDRNKRRRRRRRRNEPTWSLGESPVKN
jgi:hypothetical protein